MKTFLKILGAVFGVIVLLGIAGFVKINSSYRRDFSSTPLPEIKASADPAVIAQGEYLTHAVAHCSACHGPGEKVNNHELGQKNELQGGYVMKAGPFGTFYPANITNDPDTGIGKMSDPQLARVIKHGVDRNGGLAPLMGFAVGNMADEDLTAIVSYLRTVPPIKNQVPADEWGLLAKALSGSFNPRIEDAPKYVPAGGISVERGEYLANGPALCYGCHSTVDPTQGMKIVGPRFRGSAEAEPDPTTEGMVFAPPNLTPDPETGHMAKWDEDAFVKRFQGGRVYKGSKMPWDNFKQMTEDDLRSIYRYLKTVPAVKNATGPTYRKADWKPSDGA